MNNERVKSIAIVLISFLLPFIMGGFSGFSEKDAIWTFCIAFVLDFCYIYPKLKQLGMVFFFSPTILSVTYIYFNCIVGGYFMKNDWCLDFGVLSSFHSASSKVLLIHTELTVLFNTVLCIIACRRSGRLSFNQFNTHGFNKGGVTARRLRSIIILSVLLAILSTFSALTFHAERTTTNAILSLYFPFYLAVLACLFYNVLQCKLSNKKVLVIMLGLFIMSAMALFHSKREAFFCLILMIIMYSFDRNSISLRFRHLVLGGIVGVLSIVLVLASSLMRGYNNFEGDSFIEAVKTIPRYAASPTFMAAIGTNFEVVSAYPHTVISFDYIESGKIPTLYGETFWRVLFVPIPESLFGYKPRKMLAIYTEIYDSSFREIGGSYPVMCYADFVANFKLLSIIFIILFFSVCDKIYYSSFMSWSLYGKRIRNLTSVAFASIIILFTRGDGFSSLCLYTFLSWCTIWALVKLKLV